MKGIFEGIKVVDLTWVIVGPTVTKYLADQGATVVNVENMDHPCILRTSPPYRDKTSGINRSGYFAQQNPNKLSLGLNLDHLEGREILKRLVKWSDVVAESFSPGVMERMGLSYEELRKINPGIIHFHTSMLGHTGPRANIRGFGFQLVGYTGFTQVTGWPDRPPAQPYGPYTDPIAPRYIASALVLALLYKRKTGRGVFIDVSQNETGLQFMAPVLLDYQVNERIKEREGNSSPYHAPHGTYPCKGEDCWVAIAITSDEEWTVFQEIVGEDWVWDDKFSTLLDRKRNSVELDCLISSWTIESSAEDTMKLLQERCIPCGIVKNPCELIGDPQLAHRNAFWKLKHEPIGEHTTFAQPFILSKSPHIPPKPADRLGEHTYYVCHEILGMPDEEITSLLGEGVLQTT